MPEEELDPIVRISESITDPVDPRELTQDNEFDYSRPEVSDNLKKYIEANGMNPIFMPNKDAVSKDQMTTKQLMKQGQEAATTEDPFAATKLVMGDFRNPELQNQYWDRYAAYGDSTIKKLGFSPFRDNEKYFNDRTSHTDDFIRASGEWATLAGIGIADSASWWGGTTDNEMARAYERANAIGSSSKGGARGFATNLFLNSGYTVGIAAEMLLENIAIKAVEAGLAIAMPFTGGASAAGIVALETVQQAKNVKTGAKLAKAGKNMIKLFDTMGDIKKMRSASAKAAKVVGNKAWDVINPLENTIDFAKNAKHLQKSAGVKRAMAVGAVYRDARNIRLAFSESSLEGGMVENSMTTELLSEFKDIHGRAPNPQEAAKMGLAANAAGVKTTLQNLPLIYFSNKLTLGALTRGPLKNQLASTFAGVGGRKIIKNLSKAKIKQAVKPVSKEFWKRQKELFLNPRLAISTGAKYSVDNFAEGFQEVGQEIVSGASSEFKKAEYANDVRGGYYDYLLSNIGKQMSHQGFETFMSGFLMQMMAGPITNTMGLVTQKPSPDTQGGKVAFYIQDKFNKATKDPAKYKTWREAEQKEADEREDQFNKDITILNETLADPERYLDVRLDNMVNQKNLITLMDDAEEEGNKKEYIDFKNDAAFKGISTLVKYGMLNDFTGMLKSYKNQNASEIPAQYKGDIDLYNKHLDSMITKSEEIQKRYDYVSEKFVNPFVPNKYEVGSAQRIEETTRHKAWEAAKEQLIYQQNSFDESLKRMKSLTEKAATTAGLENASYADVAVMFDTETLSKEKDILVVELEGEKDRPEIGLENIPEAERSKETKALIKEKRDKLDKLDALDKALDGVVTGREKEDDSKLTKEARKEIRTAYMAYMKSVARKTGSMVHVANLEEGLQELIDFHMLKDRSETAARAVSILSDPQGFQDQTHRMRGLFKDLMNNRKSEIRRSLKLFRAKKDKNKMINKLLAAGIFFDPKDLAALENEGILPKTFYHVADGHRQIAYSDAKFREALNIIQEYHPEVMDLLIPEANGSLYDYQTKPKDEGDKRTYKELAAQFDFNPNTVGTKKTVKLRFVLEQIIASDFASEAERTLAAKLLENVTDDEHITFSNTESSPGSYDGTSKDQVVIDARYSSANYGKQGALPIETVILKQEIHRRTNESIDNDPQFKAEMERLMAEAQIGYDIMSPEEKAEIGLPNSPLGLEDVYSFTAEAMNNPAFQALLANSKSEADTETVSGWKAFVDRIVSNLRQILNKANGTVLNAALDIITTKLDGAPTKARKGTNASKEGSTKKSESKLGKLIPKADTGASIIYREVSTDEWQAFLNDQTVSDKRIVQMANKMVDDGGNSFTDKERQMHGDVRVKEAVKEMSDKLKAGPEKTVVTIAQKAKLLTLGYSNVTLVPRAHVLLTEGLNRLDRLDLEIAPDTDYAGPTKAELKEELIGPIMEAKTYQDVLDADSAAVTLLKEKDRYQILDTSIDDDLIEAVKARKQQLAEEVNFEEILLGEAVLLRNDEADLADVTAKTKTKLTLVNRRTNQEMKVDKKDVKKEIMYRNNRAIKDPDVTLQGAKPQTTDKDKDISDQSAAEDQGKNVQAAVDGSVDTAKKLTKAEKLQQLKDNVNCK